VKNEKLNDFFVTCFYSILNAEERALESISNGKLSLKEIHVIEAVFKAKATGENNFSNIAKLLGVTLGTLTTSFSKLEEKGYLLKEQHKGDKRVYYIEPTRLAGLINDEHTAFHKKMMEGIIDTVTEEEFGHIIAALGKLNEFFNKLS
jgi:DNA-binding MarR family transcriptional regulator